MKTLFLSSSRNNCRVLLTVGKANSSQGISSILNNFTSLLSGVGPKLEPLISPVKKVYIWLMMLVDDCRQQGSQGRRHGVLFGLQVGTAYWCCPKGLVIVWFRNIGHFVWLIVEVP